MVVLALVRVGVLWVMARHAAESCKRAIPVPMSAQQALRAGNQAELPPHCLELTQEQL